MTVRLMPAPPPCRYRYGMDARPVFITMHSNSSMTIFDWERHIEELQAALTVAVPGSDWESVHVYGPNTGGFSPPAICLRATLNPVQAAAFLRALKEAAPWFSVPVEMHATTALVLAKGGTVGDKP